MNAHRTAVANEDASLAWLEKHPFLESAAALQVEDRRARREWIAPDREPPEAGPASFLSRSILSVASL
jgi:hypothetical protein